MRRPRGLQLNTARTPPRDLHLTYYRTVRKATTEAPKRLGTRGKTLLFEHLPYIRFGGSMQGVLFLIFANGDAYFYPLNDKTKGDSPTSARMITLESSNSRKFVRTPGLFFSTHLATFCNPPHSLIRVRSPGGLFASNASPVSSSLINFVNFRTL